MIGQGWHRKTGAVDPWLAVWGAGPGWGLGGTCELFAEDRPTLFFRQRLRETVKPPTLGFPVDEPPPPILFQQPP